MSINKHGGEILKHLTEQRKKADEDKQKPNNKPCHRMYPASLLSLDRDDQIILK